MFDFNISNVQAVSNSKKALAPWGIYDVEFKGCEVKEFQGKADPTLTFKVLKTRFEGEEGYFEETIFFPKESDAVRQKYQNAQGHDYEVASNWERTKTFIAQLATVLNPEGFKKMQEMSGKFKGFDDMCKALITILTPKIGTKTKIKLIGRTKQDGTVEAVLPKFVGVNKEGQLFTSDNFIGNNLYFKPFEEGKRAAFLNAKPTPMAAADPILDIPETDRVEGLDLSSLIE
jgi:hypothetical protein